MNVFHFGTGARRLFGIYTPGRGEGRTVRAAVLCAPWGQEYLRAHRSMRQLGTQLGAAGFHVLRFDYFGTGDSAGEMTEATVAGWEDDVAHAMDELRDSSGAQRVSLVGLRLGATLAARVSARRTSEVRDLVLWDPVVSGRAYVEELRAARGGIAPISRTRESGGGVEVNGFPLTEALAAELTELDLAALADALPARTLVVTSTGEDAYREPQGPLRDAFARRASGPVVEVLDAAAAWVEYRNSGTAVTPVPVLQRIVGWLA